jgi:hypothetical protein
LKWQEYLEDHTHTLSAAFKILIALHHPCYLNLC